MSNCFIIMLEMKKIILLLLWTFWLLGVTFSDYSYQNTSVCVGDVCSIQTCSVTEYDTQEVTTTTEYPDKDISSDLYDYLIAQWETTFANWLAWTVCVSDAIYTESIAEVKKPDPTEVCEWSMPLCGNGEIDTDLGEECDEWIDKNGTNNVWCSQDCKIISYCGDWMVNKELGEECDPWFDAEFCLEESCMFVENLSPDFDIDVWDPVTCEWDFEGGIIFSDEINQDLDSVIMYLDVDCEWDGTYVSLDPILDEQWNYLAKLNYTDPTSERYLIGSCHVKYWGCFKTDGWDKCVDKTANVILEGVCLTEGWSNVWWRNTWWSWWSNAWVSWWSNVWGSWWSDSQVSKNSIITSVSWTPVQEVLFWSASDNIIILNPSTGWVIRPMKLEETGWGYMSRREF